MDIIAKAKPVRFRIVSGGVECTSLDDLRTHFDLKSVADTINDGRLEKWLNYIKEFEFAEKIKEIGKFDSSDMKMSLRVLSLFTGKEYNRENFMSDVEFIEFLDKDRDTAEFALDLIKDTIHEDVDVLLYAYHNHCDLIPDVHTYFAPFLDCDNPEVLWEYGFDLLTSPILIGNKEKEQEGISYIEKAAQKGWKDAVDFLKSYHSRHINDSRKEKITKILKDNLRTSNKIDLFQKLTWYNSYTDVERDLFEICEIVCKCVGYNRTLGGIREQLESNVNKNTNNHYHVIIEFLLIYTKESWGYFGDSGAIASYNRLDYGPSHQRAKDLSVTFSKKIITTSQNVKIKMPINPDSRQYEEFVINFLSNILYF